MRVRETKQSAHHHLSPTLRPILLAPPGDRLVEIFLLRVTDNVHFHDKGLTVKRGPYLVRAEALKHFRRLLPIDRPVIVQVASLELCLDAPQHHSWEMELTVPAKAAPLVG